MKKSLISVQSWTRKKQKHSRWYLQKLEENQKFKLKKQTAKNKTKDMAKFAWSEGFAQATCIS